MTNIFVEDLGAGTTAEDLTATLSRYGKVERVEVIRERNTSVPLSFAFVEMDLPGAAPGGAKLVEVSSTWTRHIPVNTDIDAFVGVAARAVEVFGTREKAMRWLRTPLPWLGDKTPLALLHSSDGIQRVEDALGRIEQGVW